MIADVGSTEESIRCVKPPMCPLDSALSPPGWTQSLRTQDLGYVSDVKVLEDVPRLSSLLGRYPMSAHVRGCFPSFPGYIAGNKTTTPPGPHTIITAHLLTYRRIVSDKRVSVGLPNEHQSPPKIVGSPISQSPWRVTVSL